MTEFNGGHIAAGHQVWTATFGDEAGYEELDVMVPVGSTDADVRAAVQLVLTADYMPGLRIVDITPFRGVTIW